MNIERNEAKKKYLTPGNVWIDEESGYIQIILEGPKNGKITTFCPYVPEAGINVRDVDRYVSMLEPVEYSFRAGIEGPVKL